MVVSENSPKEGGHAYKEYKYKGNSVRTEDSHGIFSNIRGIFFQTDEEFKKALESLPEKEVEAMEKFDKYVTIIRKEEEAAEEKKKKAGEILRKNVSIAKMVGKDVISEREFNSNPPWDENVWIAESLKYNSNANDQLEALNFLYKKGYDWRIESGNYCTIFSPEGIEIVYTNIDPLEGSAVFEALYELSLHYLIK